MHRARVRPDPVSCQSCRAKKLKCNRVQPCSNCNARGITCNFLVPPARQKETNFAVASSAEILRRIERLESAIAQSVRAETETHSKYAADDALVTRRLDINPNDANADSVNGASLLQSEEEDSTCHLLENIGTREDGILPCMSDGVDFRVSSMDEILTSRVCVQLPTPVSDYHRPRSTVVTFPTYNAAVQLFETYHSKVDVMLRIVHIPTVRSLIQGVYLRISRKDSVPPGQAALLLSLFAIGAFFYEPSQDSEVATTEHDANSLSKALCKGALDVLDHSHRTTSGTLEDVQACMVLALVIHHHDGFSTRGRLLWTTATSIARDLRLHRLDADSQSLLDKETTMRDMLDREVKRRVFWYLASTDWLWSTFSGPQEGTYFIHPNQINVKLPKAGIDDDLVLGEESESIIGPQPTGMTFVLEKLRLAHLCREITDTVPFEISNITHIPYERIIALDAKLQEYISSLPFFFRLDPESREESKAIEPMYPKIPFLRYCIMTAVHSRRCKLHQRFVLRQSLDPRYAYSRRACLESARAVIHVYQDVAAFRSPSTLMARMGMAIHFTHFALAVLVMDLCFNRDAPDQAEIKEEVKTTLQIFESARDVSPLLRRCFSSLFNILQKHNVYLTDTFISLNDQVAAQDSNPGFYDQMVASQLGPDLYQQNLPLDTSFDQFWQLAAQSEPNPDSLAWDDLFSALDTRPM